MAALWVLVQVVTAGLVLAGAVWFSRRNRARHRALARWARSVGYSYRAMADGMLTYFQGPPMDRAVISHAFDVMERSAGPRRALLCNVSCTSRIIAKDPMFPKLHERQASVSLYGLVAVSLPVALPAFDVHPHWRPVVAGPGHGHGHARVTFESEAFNKHYNVRAANQKIAYELLPARNIELLLDLPQTSMHVDGYWLVFLTNEWLNPAGMAGALNLLDEFVDNIPHFVWTDYGSQPPVGAPPPE